MYELHLIITDCLFCCNDHSYDFNSGTSAFHFRSRTTRTVQSDSTKTERHSWADNNNHMHNTTPSNCVCSVLCGN